MVYVLLKMNNRLLLFSVFGDVLLSMNITSWDLRDWIHKPEKNSDIVRVSLSIFQLFKEYSLKVHKGRSVSHHPL